MSAHTLRILSLYPRLLNLYGDVGNLLVLRKRAEWRGIEVEIVNFDVGSDPELLTGIDIIVGGGGQDSSQALAQADLVRIAPALHQLLEDYVPALTICGSFQLFGKHLKTADGRELEGIGILDLCTEEGPQREIGNVVASSTEFGELVGYENHSGRTVLGAGLEPLANIVSGFGNNGADGTEGARYRNVIGTYLHGPLLPKNPQIADFLIAKGLERRYGEAPELSPLPSSYLNEARSVAKGRIR